MTDRITQAWQLRNNLHKQLKTHGKQSLDQLFSAFSDVNESTLRKSLDKLRKDGDVFMSGSKGHVGYFTAVTSCIKPEKVVRKALAEAGINKFVRAAETRQLILDWCNKMGRSTTRDAALACDLTIEDAYRKMRRMAEEGELQLHGSGFTASYTPLATKTISAQAMQDQQNNKVTASRKKSAAAKQEQAQEATPAWLYVHIPGNPIPNQEAIGSGRKRVYASSTCSMI